MPSRLLTRALFGASVLAIAAIPAPAAAQRIDRIIAFGDSYADTGNALRLAGINPVSTQVYTTGRFSGGTNYIDTLSMLLDAPQYNFAIGGSRTNNQNQNAGLPGFTFQVQTFLAGGGILGFPAMSPTLGEGDLVTVSIGGNDARAYQQGGGTLAGAPGAAATAVASATANMNLLVGAGAPTISFLAGDTGRLPEIAGDPAGAAVRTAYSTAFNTGMQSTLAGYAGQGVMVHYLDLSLVLDQIQANPAAYGFTAGITCPAFPNPTCIVNPDAPYVFYGDLLHLTSRGFAVVAQYVATQLQAPLTMQATSDLGLDTARQFGRTLTSRIDLSAPRDGDLAEGVRFFVVGDMFSRDVRADRRTDAFDIDSVGATAGIAYGWGNGVAGIAGNHSRPRAKFAADISETRTESWQIGGFAGMTIAGAFAQGYVGYGWDDHRIERGGVVEPMRSDPDGSHWLAGAKAGYLMPMGSIRVGPVVALDYARARVGSYTESGDPALTLNVSSVSAKSLTGGLGAELRGDFLSGGMQLRPFAAAMVETDFLGDGRTVRFAQTSAPTIVNSWQLEDRSTDVYGRLTGGASAEILRQVSLNALVSGTLGRDDGNEVSAHVGLRFGL